MHTVIIGNGISGISAARWIRKLSAHEITVISSESEYFYSRTALMYIYMGHMRFEDTKPYENFFWAKNNIQLIKDHVTEIDFQHHQLATSGGATIDYDKLVLAVGSKSNKFGWPGQDLEGVSGLYSLQDLEIIEKYSSNLNRAVIVGGGLIGVELAEMFHSRSIPVTMLVREESYWDMVLPPEESQMITRHIYENHIDLRLNTNLKEIIDNGDGKVSGVITQETEDNIACGYVGLTPGVSPNIGWIKDSELACKKGILVNQYLETNITDVYAVGDCAELTTPAPGRRGVEAIWYTGRMMGETCAYNICGSRVAYDPGLWFNSAKFFDIEYQVYGDMQARLPEGQKTVYWEHDDGKRSIRINYCDKDQTVLGFNLMGIRFRHEVCHKWIVEKVSLMDVLASISMAFFDPELYQNDHKRITSELSRQAGISVPETKAFSFDTVLHFLKK